MRIPRLLRPFACMPFAAWSCAAVLSASPEVPAAPAPGLHYYYPVPALKNPKPIRADVVVYGGTPAGVSAAVAASRSGKSAVLAVFRRHVGGMTSGGLTTVDLGNPKTIGGLTAEFFNRMGKWSRFKPSAAESLFRLMLAEAGVPVYYEYRLDKVEKDGDRITALVFENGARIEAKEFVDATYEGDLLARAGVSYTVGREGNQKYRETGNGYYIAKGHQFPFPVDPYRVPGDPASGLLPGISGEPPRQAGSGDRWVQAYNFRMQLTDAPNRVPFPKPAAYDADTYALLARYLNTRPDYPFGFDNRTGPVQLICGDSNNGGPFSTDFVGGSFRWPEASYPERERIFQAHVAYQQGLMYFLANDPSVPPAMRARVNAFGLDPDEFPETAHWPHELYAREGRRMVSRYVMTERNCLSQTTPYDPVALASYTMDAHLTSRTVIDGAAVTEGNVQLRVPKPYPVSYRALVPKRSEASNLLVPVALSASHIAFGSIRMEPVFMMLGQSAGLAAALAIDDDVAVQNVSYAKLRQRLLGAGQKLEWTPPSKPAVAPQKQDASPQSPSGASGAPGGRAAP